MVKTILKAVAVGVSVGTIVLLNMDQIQERNAIILLAVGLSCLAINSLSNKRE